MSSNRDTAFKVGQRHGKPIVLVVNAQLMHAGGYEFFCSENGVWLVEEVPPEFLGKG